MKLKLLIPAISVLLITSVAHAAESIPSSTSGSTLRFSHGEYNLPSTSPILEDNSVSEDKAPESTTITCGEEDQISLNDLKTMIANNDPAISEVCTSGITNMASLFNNNTTFNQDISKWDTSNVTTMHQLFRNTDFNGDISQWDTSNVVTMYGMFRGSKFNGDISNWNVSKLKNINYMFHGAYFNNDISQWDVSNVVHMAYTFYSSRFSSDISQWNVSSVTSMSNMFSFSQFNSNISQWNVANVINMDYMFYASPFNYDISGWDVNKVNGWTSFKSKSNLINEHTPPKFL